MDGISGTKGNIIVSIQRLSFNGTSYVTGSKVRHGMTWDLRTFRTMSIHRPNQRSRDGKRLC